MDCICKQEDGELTWLCEIHHDFYSPYFTNAGRIFECGYLAGWENKTGLHPYPRTAFMAWRNEEMAANPVLDAKIKLINGRGDDSA